MRFLRIVGNVAMVAVCLIAVAFAALSLMSRGAPSDVRTWAGGYKPFVVLSGSMEPAIRVGGVLLVKRVDAAAVGKGDIITFLTPQDVGANLKAPSVTTHRVTEVTRDERGALAFRVRGDANEDADSALVPAENVLGRAVVSVPFLGYVSRFASTKAGLLTLIVVPALLLAAMEIVSLVRGKARRRAPERAREAQ